MNKLFYEVEKDFKAQFYIVMMGDSRTSSWKPVNFGETSGRFGHGLVNDDPQIEGEPVEIYDRETAMALLAHHALNSASGFELRLVPVFVPEVISGPSKSPYLNSAASRDHLVARIKDAAEFSAEINPDDDQDSWEFPASLGGGEVVPATPAKKSLTNTVISVK